MIPKIIHYCWFGRGEMPELALKCIESWHKYMPDWEYMLWNEDNFDINSNVYTRQAYEARKFAFVSDYVRLKVLNDIGGVYMDVDFQVYKSFDDLLYNKAFAGFEGSKTNPVMMGVIASESGGEWVKEQLDNYLDRPFILSGEPDMTTNVRYVTDHMIKNGFLPNGKEQDYKDLHVFPVDYFCPKQTTGEYKRTNNTYCEQVSASSSWLEISPSWKTKLLAHATPSVRSRIIKLKRKLFG